jgi:segregation and condensation protein A
VSAFGRVMREHVAPAASNIVYDDTPIQVFMDRIRDALAARGRMPMRDLFQNGMHKSTLVGIFLAVLELVRNHGLQAGQEAEFGEIWIDRAA